MKKETNIITEQPNQEQAEQPNQEQDIENDLKFCPESFDEFFDRFIDFLTYYFYDDVERNRCGAPEICASTALVLTCPVWFPVECCQCNSLYKNII